MPAATVTPATMIKSIQDNLHTKITINAANYAYQCANLFDVLQQV